MKTYIENAIYLAWKDLLTRYKKSVLGPFWFTLGNLIGILGLGVIWGAILKEELATFLPSLAIGLVTWFFISGVLIESCTAFTSHGQIIRNVKMPLWFFTTRIMARQTINLSHNIFIVIGILIYYQKLNTSLITLSLVGMVILILNMGWISYVISVLATRYRDIEYTITSFLPILFFISPVIFRPDHIPESIKAIALYNPIAYLIEVIRSPILGTNPESYLYMASSLMLLIGFTIAFWVHKKHTRRLVYWL